MKRITTSFAALGLVAGSAIALAAGTAGARTASAAAAMPQINVALNGKSIAVSGAMQSGAVTIQSTVTGVKQAEPTLVRLNPGVTFPQAAPRALCDHIFRSYLVVCD